MISNGSHPSPTDSLPLDPFMKLSSVFKFGGNVPFATLLIFPLFYKKLYVVSMVFPYFSVLCVLVSLLTHVCWCGLSPWLTLYMFVPLLAPANVTASNLIGAFYSLCCSGSLRSVSKEGINMISSVALKYLSLLPRMKSWVFTDCSGSWWSVLSTMTWEEAGWTIVICSHKTVKIAWFVTLCHSPICIF